MFFRTTICENEIPFLLKLDIPNGEMEAAIVEGRRIAFDSSVEGYINMDALKMVLKA